MCTAVTRIDAAHRRSERQERDRSALTRPLSV
jgi:hypothetical protein